MTLKLATAAYPLSFLETARAYSDKIGHWVGEAASQGAELLLFPEYAGMDLAGLAGADRAAHPREGRAAAADRIDVLIETHQTYAKEFNVVIIAGSAPVWDQGRLVNRAYIFSPSGEVAWQDKIIMTPFERAPWGISGSAGLNVFSAPWGRFAILICYDSEFPLLARAMPDLDLLLVPSCTETIAGYWRVRIGAMARALEGQIVTAMASLLSDVPQIYGVEENHGAGGVFGPPDAKMGLPADGIFKLGAFDEPAWTIVDVDPGLLRRTKKEGATLNVVHWPEQEKAVQNVYERPFCQNNP